MRTYNPVREMILRKLEAMRVDMVDGDLQSRTNLEALIDVIFDRAISNKGRVPIEAARLMFEYGVGKPNQTVDMTVRREAPKSREEVMREVREAEKELGIPEGFFYEMLEDKSGDALVESAETGGHSHGEPVPRPRREVDGPRAQTGDRAAREERGEEEAPGEEPDRPDPRSFGPTEIDDPGLF